MNEYVLTRWRGLWYIFEIWQYDDIFMML